MKIKIRDLDEFTIEDMKVFRIDEYSWIAAPTLLHALVEYDSQVGLEIEYLQDIQECDIEKEGMWDSDNVTEQERNDVESGKITLLPANEVVFRQFGIFAGEVCKWTSFADVIKKTGVGAYTIASTEY